MSNASIPSGYLKTSLKNGLGRYVCQLKRVTLRFCKEQHQSKGMRYASLVWCIGPMLDLHLHLENETLFHNVVYSRDFAENHMINFCQKNPSVAVYAQVRRHKAPYLVAEYCEWLHDINRVIDIVTYTTSIYLPVSNRFEFLRQGSFI